MELTPTKIRRKTFELVRRGFDPQEVGSFLEKVAEHVASIERDLDESKASLSSAEARVADAKAAEEAVHLTIAAATKAKEEMLAKARAEADEARSSADEQAEQAVGEARREALSLLEDSRRDAQEMVDAARRENAELTDQVEQLQAVVDRTKAVLEAVAGGSLDQLTEASEQLAGLGAVASPGGAVTGDGDGAGTPADPSVPLPDAVDQLLDQIRERR